MHSLTIDAVDEICQLADKCLLRRRQRQKEGKPFGVDPEELALLKTLRTFGKGELIELCALMWLGRGGSDEDWDELIFEAQSQRREEMAMYIAEKTDLSQYLRDGLKTLDLSKAV